MLDKRQWVSTTCVQDSRKSPLQLYKDYHSPAKRQVLYHKLTLGHSEKHYFFFWRQDLVYPRLAANL